ncbi:2-C-methyl-D-erythritol 4-phosphate cytidylyltransferase, partial [Salmonella enterica]|uniref:2-C-methyl-D-erythritol 4-phosphate cytidylyltransferase n=1 Tax=Salmonella enterica TaxID=28901 RepID=UPI00398C3B3E
SVHALLPHPRVTRVVIATSPRANPFSQLPLANPPHITSVHGGNARAVSVFPGLQPLARPPGVTATHAVHPTVISIFLNTRLPNFIPITQIINMFEITIKSLRSR